MNFIHPKICYVLEMDVYFLWTCVQFLLQSSWKYKIGRTIKQQLQHDMAYKINNLCWCGKIEMSILYIIIWFSHFVLTFESYAWHVDLLWRRHGTPTTCDLCPHGLQKWFSHFVLVFFPHMDIIAMWKENHKGIIL
jgi:hypothetical protein